MSLPEERRSFKEELHLELSHFLQKLNQICLDYKIELASDGQYFLMQDPNSTTISSVASIQ